MNRRYRLLLLATHPVQYSAQLFRELAQHPQLEILVAYCSLQGAEAGLDPDFGVKVAWDVPLLDGYPWIKVPNKSPCPGIGRFFGLLNPGVWKLVRRGRFDAVVCYTGYVYASFWIAVAAAKSKRAALLFGTDAHDLRPRDGRPWKTALKRRLWPRLFRLADVVLAPSGGTVALMRSLRLPADRVVLTPFVVHNDWWLERAAQVEPAAVRAAWGVPEGAPVVLFCAKLQPWKRPQDALRALARAGLQGTHLVYAGEGPLRAKLQAEAESLGLARRVHFTGFANQSELPAIYRAANLLVLPSEYEPFGVVVNEAMLCGCAVAVSNRVGAGFDLVQPGQNGFVYPVGDVDALAGIFCEVLPDGERLRQMGEAARKRMETWTSREYVEALLTAVERAVRLKSEESNLAINFQTEAHAREHRRSG